MLQETKNIQIGELIVDLSKRSVITGNTEVRDRENCVVWEVLL